MDFIKNFFKLEERGSKISTELVAGLTTFLAMAYILPVNTNMLAQTGMPVGGIFFILGWIFWIVTVLKDQKS